ncbi:alpha-N-acetyl-neuraminyl-2,3-beta-galactosyl-1,3-N-acetyl-galactosaminide alpha-2,6-sialyltransferase-like [Branchiostoma floridae x Branchiostoma japonicum]
MFRRSGFIVTSLLLGGLTYALLTTEMFITRRDTTSQQTKDHGEAPETHVTPERTPETHVTPERTPETHVTPERTPESVIEHPKPRDPEPIDLINPLKGYVGVPSESKQLNLSCGVCALVTGSGRMLNYKAGNEIDQADCVIRMNEGPVLGYEKHVGSKTTLRVMCFRSIYIAPINAAIYKGNSTLLGWGPPRDMDPKQGKAYQKLRELQKSHPDMEVFKITEERMQYADRVFEKASGRARKGTNTWLSTGWFTMMVAMEICDVIKVYGMASEDYCRNHPGDQTAYHYFTGARYRMEDYKECSYQNWEQNARAGGHRYLTEKSIFAHWAPLNNITFLNPSWDT